MTQFKTSPHPFRAALFSAVMLFSTALSGAAMAQTVSAALPDLAPEQIARDVRSEYNNRTGAREYIAPTFDPFEDDPSMAASAQLRSNVQATAIDGTPLRGGAILDLGFYYNSGSNDPYDTRGFEQAVFLSGAFAPAIRRDNRILECSSNVRETIYEHSRYYSPSLLLSFYRPYRHYRGHSGFGYGHGGHGYWRRGGLGYDYGSGRGWRRGGHTGGRVGRPHRRPHDGPTTGPRPSVGEGGDTVIDRPRRPRRPITDRDPERDGPADVDRRREPGYISPGSAAGRKVPGRSITPISRRRTNDNLDARTGGTRAPSGRGGRTDRNRDVRPDRVTRPSQPKRPDVARPSVSKPSVSKPTVSRPTPAPAPAPRVSSPKSKPTPVSRPRPVSKPSRSTQKPSRPSVSRERSPRREGRARLNFFPNDYYGGGGAQVVRTQDVDCAREETLSVHIPQARLEAARFDGLTVLVLDRAGQEYPVFIPPNYIEGFRQASAAGQPQIQPAPQYQEPLYQEPSYQRPQYQPQPYQPPQMMACPSGTVLQTDGTCLQTPGTIGAYPRP